MGSVAILLLCAVLLVGYCKSVHDSREYVHAEGGLAPFPRSAEKLALKSGWFVVKGSFTAPVNDIIKWIDDSPGLSGVEAEVLGAGKTRYTNQKGNRITTVTIDEVGKTVEFSVTSDPL